MNAPLPDAIRKALESVTLDDKYSLAAGRAFDRRRGCDWAKPAACRLSKNGANLVGQA